MWMMCSFAAPKSCVPVSANGVHLVAGVDEAGRGALAGPVLAAAVILDPTRPITGITDSKKLSAAKRDRLSVAIQERALAWSIAHASVAEIEQLNILQASLLAMTRALRALQPAPERALIDGVHVPMDAPCATEAVIGGDLKVAAIGAASILAKVARDAVMCRLDQQAPGYGFANHKGYGTAQHQAALRCLGPNARHHRKTFAPITKLLASQSHSGLQ